MSLNIESICLNVRHKAHSGVSAQHIQRFNAELSRLLEATLRRWTMPGLNSTIKEYQQKNTEQGASLHLPNMNIHLPEVDAKAFLLGAQSYFDRLILPALQKQLLIVVSQSLAQVKPLAAVLELQRTRVGENGDGSHNSRLSHAWHSLELQLLFRHAGSPLMRDVGGSLAYSTVAFSQLVNQVNGSGLFRDYFKQALLQPHTLARVYSWLSPKNPKPNGKLKALLGALFPSLNPLPSIAILQALVDRGLGGKKIMQDYVSLLVSGHSDNGNDRVIALYLKTQRLTQTSSQISQAHQGVLAQVRNALLQHQPEHWLKAYSNWLNIVAHQGLNTKDHQALKQILEKAQGVSWHDCTAAQIEDTALIESKGRPFNREAVTGQESSTKQESISNQESVTSKGLSRKRESVITDGAIIASGSLKPRPAIMDNKKTGVLEGTKRPWLACSYHHSKALKLHLGLQQLIAAIIHFTGSVEELWAHFNALKAYIQRHEGSLSPIDVQELKQALDALARQQPQRHQHLARVQDTAEQVLIYLEASTQILEPHSPNRHWQPNVTISMRKSFSHVLKSFDSHVHSLSGLWQLVKTLEKWMQGKAGAMGFTEQAVFSVEQTIRRLLAAKKRLDDLPSLEQKHTLQQLSEVVKTDKPPAAAKSIANEIVCAVKCLVTALSNVAEARPGEAEQQRNQPIDSHEACVQRLLLEPCLPIAIQQALLENSKTTDSRDNAEAIHALIIALRSWAAGLQGRTAIEYSPTPTDLPIQAASAQQTLAPILTPAQKKLLPQQQVDPILQKCQTRINRLGYLREVLEQYLAAPESDSTFIVKEDGLDSRAKPKTTTTAPVATLLNMVVLVFTMAKNQLPCALQSVVKHFIRQPQQSTALIAKQHLTVLLKQAEVAKQARQKTLKQQAQEPVSSIANGTAGVPRKMQHSREHEQAPRFDSGYKPQPSELRAFSTNYKIEGEALNRLSDIIHRLIAAHANVYGSVKSTKSDNPMQIMVGALQCIFSSTEVNKHKLYELIVTSTLKVREWQAQAVPTQNACLRAFTLAVKELTQLKHDISRDLNPDHKLNQGSKSKSPQGTQQQSPTENSGPKGAQRNKKALSLVVDAEQGVTQTSSASELPLQRRQRRALQQVFNPQDGDFSTSHTHCWWLPVVEDLLLQTPAKVSQYTLEQANKLLYTSDLKAAEKIVKALAVSTQARSQSLSQLSQHQSQLKSLINTQALSVVQKKLSHTISKYRQQQTELHEGLPSMDGGLVLLWPYLQGLFSKHGLLVMDENREDCGGFVDDAAQLKAHALVLALMGPTADDNICVVANALVGLELETFVETESILTESDLQTVEGLLTACIHNWAALKQMSNSQFRQLFLSRPAQSQVTAEGIHVIVEKKTEDILINKMPWGLGYITLPWLGKKLIQVEWPYGGF